MAAKKEKEALNVQETLDALNKTYGDGSVMRMSDPNVLKVDRISSGSLNIDKITGGGYPMGRIIEIFGPESSGKTTLALHAIVEAQKKYPNKLCVFVDAEHALDPAYAENVGVDLSRLVLTQPDSGEQGLEIAEALIRSGDVSVVVVDSVDALTPEATLRGEMGDTNIARLARLMSQGCRKLTGAVQKTGTLLIFLNQIRDKVGVMFGSPETTPGGKALRFYATQRIRIAKQDQAGQKLDKQGEFVSAKIKCIKNKVARPFLETFITIQFGKGIVLTPEIVDFAVEYGVMQKAGSWFSYKGEKLGQGRAKIIELLDANEELRNEIYELVITQMNSQK